MNKKVFFFLILCLACDNETQREVNRLREQLNGKEEEQTAALDRLARIGPGASAALPDLKRLYRRSGLQTRERIVPVVLAIDPEGKECIPFLKEVIKDRFVHVGEMGIKGLRQVGARQEIDFLTGLLVHEIPGHRAEAAHALAVLLPESRRSEAALLAALEKEKDPRSRAFMQMALLRLDPASLPRKRAFEKFFTDPDAEARQFAVGFLQALPFDSAEKLVILRRALKDRDIRTRRMATRISGLMGEEAAELIPLLFEIFYEKDHALSREAIRALGRVDPSGKKLMPHLTRALRSRDSRVRTEAVVGLGQIADPGSLSDLRRMLSDPADLVKVEAMRAISRLGATGQTALPDFLPNLRSPNPEVAFVAAESLGSFGPSVIGPLEAYLTSPSAEVREKAVLVLGWIEAPDPRIEALLARALSDKEKLVQSAAKQALQNRKGDKVP